MITLASNNNGYGMLTIAETFLWFEKGGGEQMRRHLLRCRFESFGERVIRDEEEPGVIFPVHFGDKWSNAEAKFRKYVDGRLSGVELRQFLAKARTGLVMFDRHFFNCELDKLACDCELVYLGLLKHHVRHPATEMLFAALSLEGKVVPQDYAAAA